MTMETAGGTTSLDLQFAPPMVNMSPRSPMECEFGNERKFSDKLPTVPANNDRYDPTCDSLTVVEKPISTIESTAEVMMSSSGKVREGSSHCNALSSTEKCCKEEPYEVTHVEKEQQAGKTSRNKKKKKVQWAKRVRIKEIRHLNDFTDAEMDELWMCMADYQMIKTVVKTTVTMMMNGEEISKEDVDFCTRGLESRTKAGSRIRSRYKLRARSAVLNEQDLQRDEGFFDQEFVAMASMDESLVCRDDARKRGLQDEAAVADYVADARSGVRAF